MHAAQAPADARFAALPAREGLGKAVGEPFGSRSWAPRVSVPSQPAVLPPAPSPMPYRIAGQVLQDGHTYVVLVRGDRVVFNVREGQTLEDGYRVESIRADGVTLVYLPLDVREHLAAAPTVLRVGPGRALAASPPPQPSATLLAAPDEPRASRPAPPHWEAPSAPNEDVIADEAG
jgi:hypothetical protein